MVQYTCMGSSMKAMRPRLGKLLLGFLTQIVIKNIVFEFPWLVLASSDDKILTSMETSRSMTSRARS